MLLDDLLPPRQSVATTHGEEDYGRSVVRDVIGDEVFRPADSTAVFSNSRSGRDAELRVPCARR
jgi:hypothetical protein